ncbi:hypothetical protein GCM10023188_41320 [Pontibacter saemangeumensis]|uniref:Uncharacterized protein n=1 Tax=Pontibacter saemangeumensis TaxID=1084525 RepID=A0ABP8M4H2_9BACT
MLNLGGVVWQAAISSSKKIMRAEEVKCVFKAYFSKRKFNKDDYPKAKILISLPF